MAGRCAVCPLQYLDRGVDDQQLRRRDRQSFPSPPVLVRLQALDQENDDPISIQAEPEGTNLRICSTTFRNVIRREHHGNDSDDDSDDASKEDSDENAILKKIESVQLAMTNMIHEVYTMAHMTTLLVSDHSI